MKNKKEMDVVELIAWRFEQMTGRAAKLSTEDVKAYADDNKYVRICGESYRAVSLDDDYPLVGYAPSGVSKLETIKNHFGLKIPKEKLIESKKEERRLQSYIIRKALQSNRDLIDILDLKSDFDELRFCLDEISLGDNNKKVPLTASDKPEEGIVRCDILAVGKRAGSDKWTPVLIELKYSREMKRLEDQLKNFISVIDNNKNLQAKLEELITTIVPEAKSYNSIITKVIVWPAPKSQGNGRALDESILEVVYDSNGKNERDVSTWKIYKRPVFHSVF